MRSHGIAFALALATLLGHSAEAGVNQWTVTGPQINVQAMAVDPRNPNVLYAVAEDTVARSDDRGETWTLTTVPGLLAPSTIRIAPSVPTTFYALGFGVLFRSTTGGTSWTRRGLPSVGFQHDLKVDPNSADVLVMAATNFCFLGCSGGGVYRSDNGGGSWRSIGLKDSNVWHVAIDSTSSQVVYASTHATLFRTVNGGRSWTAISPQDGGEIHDIVVDPLISATVYAATEAGIFRSLDSGNSWELIRSSQYGSTLGDPPHGSRLVLASAMGTAVSLDQGETWRELSTANSGLDFRGLTQIVAAGDRYYMVTNLAGVSGQIVVYELRLPRRRSVR
ncbi:MAG TPA: hypothetical protein VEK57_02165 [Thermoanaerobaculia bacterium]|nr:hypothetical protein [Thermoanaerobaculia bacterium]